MNEESKSTPQITKELLRELGDWRADKEGHYLAQSGNVQNLHFDSSILKGAVKSRAGTIVHARLKLGKSKFDIDNLCSCYQAREEGLICAHVVALVYAYLDKDKPKIQKQNLSDRQPLKTAKPLESIPPQFKRVLIEDASPESQSLELTVLLPLDLAKSWKTGEMRIILEGSIDTGSTKPFATIIPQPKIPYIVSEADDQLLTAVEKCNSGLITGVWILHAKDFDTFFTALSNHPRVMLGKRSTVQIRTQDHRPRIYLNLQPTGELHLHLEKVKSVRGEMLGAWSFDGSVLERKHLLPSAYQMLSQGEITLTRSELARFYEYELPTLKEHCELILNEQFDQLEFSVSTPQICAILDGSLNGISVRLEARYEGHSYLLDSASNKALEHSWVPDTKNPYRYWTRDSAAEVKARQEIAAAGFEPAQRNHELYLLRTEAQTGYFLANTLPKWQAKWKIEFGGRMQDFLKKCEIIEPEILIRPSGENWLALDVSFKNNQGVAAMTNQEIQQLLQKGISHKKLSNGRIAIVPTEAVQDFQNVIFDCAVEQSESEIKIHQSYGSYLNEALREGKWSISSRSNWQPPTSIEQIGDIPVPTHLREILRPYQRTGINWLYHLGQNGMGGILADEMGLGKTVQALVTLATRYESIKDNLVHKPSLVVCPTSLVTNWLAEANRFTPTLNTLLITGSKRHSLIADIPTHHLVVTSYALLRRDSEKYSNIEFDTIILDEAQQIKNRFSLSAQAVKSLQAERRFVLTGTPMENSLTDLWSIFDFLMPGYLGPATEFKERYEIPIEKTSDKSALRRLRQRLGPFVLRRTKAEVAPELPPKIEQIASCEMSQEQKSVYQSILAVGRQEVFDHAGKGSQAKQRMAVLMTLMRLRQASCHLDLLPQDEPKHWTEPSSKLDMCLELIEEAISGNHRILVFSQFVRMLKLVLGALEEKQIDYCYLDGATVDRQYEVQKFQNSPEIPVFLISLKAGGTGLNLTGADTVIHFDPWWNPAVEEQATARAHRIGQSNIVTSYKLIAKDSVEEKIVRLQEKKRELIASTLTSDEAFVQNLTSEELQGLLE